MDGTGSESGSELPGINLDPQESVYVTLKIQNNTTDGSITLSPRVSREVKKYSPTCGLKRNYLHIKAEFIIQNGKNINQTKISK